MQQLLLLAGLLCLLQRSCHAFSAGARMTMSLYDHSLNDLDGKEVKLASRYKGKILLLENVASL